MRSTQDVLEAHHVVIASLHQHNSSIIVKSIHIKKTTNLVGHLYIGPWKGAWGLEAIVDDFYVCASARECAFVYMSTRSWHRSAGALSSRRVYFKSRCVCVCLRDALGGVWATAVSDLCSVQITHQLECLLLFFKCPSPLLPSSVFCFPIQPSAPSAKDPRGAVVGDKLAGLPPDRWVLWQLPGGTSCCPDHVLRSLWVRKHVKNKEQG